jgi:hypothetical protein
MTLSQLGLKWSTSITNGMARMEKDICIPLKLSMAKVQRGGT